MLNDFKRLSGLIYDQNDENFGKKMKSKEEGDSLVRIVSESEMMIVKTGFIKNYYAKFIPVWLVYNKEGCLFIAHQDNFELIDEESELKPLFLEHIKY